MKRTWILAIPLLVVLVLLIGMGAGACGGGVDGETPPPPGDENGAPPPGDENGAPPPEDEGEVTPQPGEWTASTGRSEFTFTFTVSPDSTGITEICYSLFAFECAGWVQTVTPSTVEKSPPCPITGGQFTIEISKSPQYGQGLDLDIFIQGEFDETGTHASGTWEISVEGTTCPAGTWEASPSS